jgi:hypothetical protein
MWKRTLILAIALPFLIAGLLFVQVNAQKEGNAKSVEAPKAILSAFQKAYPKAEIKNVSKEVKEGVTYYEVESVDGGNRRDLLYKEDGTVFEIEEGLSAEAIPANIKKSLDTKFPEGEIRKAEKITKGGSVQFEILMENQEENLEVVIDASGKIISQSNISENDEENEGDEPEED